MSDHMNAHTHKDGSIGYEAICFCYDNESTELREARALNLRWNKAATNAGYAGSEFIDDPEFVFKRVQNLKDRHHDVQMALVKVRRELAKYQKPLDPDEVRARMGHNLDDEYESEEAWDG